MSHPACESPTRWQVVSGLMTAGRVAGGARSGPFQAPSRGDCGMKARAILGLSIAAGLATTASAQENIAYTWNFVEVAVGTNNPVTNPNGIIEPGECARLQLNVNVTPGIGSNATYTPPPAPGTGTIAGLGSVFFDL